MSGIFYFNYTFSINHCRGVKPPTGFGLPRQRLKTLSAVVFTAQFC